MRFYNVQLSVVLFQNGELPGDRHADAEGVSGVVATLAGATDVQQVLATTPTQHVSHRKHPIEK